MRRRALKRILPNAGAMPCFAVAQPAAPVLRLGCLGAESAANDADAVVLSDDAAFAADPQAVGGLTRSRRLPCTGGLGYACNGVLIAGPDGTHMNGRAGPRVAEVAARAGTGGDSMIDRHQRTLSGLPAGPLAHADEVIE